VHRHRRKTGALAGRCADLKTAARSRELRVSQEVAQLLPAAALAQLQAVIDDPDNVCCMCEKLIDGPSAEVVVFTDGETTTMVKLAHSDCMPSGVGVLPGLGEAFRERVVAAESFGMATCLGLRRRLPRALVFLELEVLIGGHEEDPLEFFSKALGLAPITGSIEDIEPVATELFTIKQIDEGLGLRTAHGIDTVPAAASELSPWLEAAAGSAIVVVARGLGLRRPEPTIEEALTLRPSWAAIVAITGK
jgi:hypothetical protein